MLLALLNRNLKRNVPIVVGFRNVSVIKGKATIDGTLGFVSKSNLKLHHRFDKCGLYINPVIHGSPNPTCTKGKKYYDGAFKHAVLKNRSNCMVVYSHNTKHGKPWFADNLNLIISTESDIKRDEIVTIADLGNAADAPELYRRLADASRLSGLQSIDIVFFEVNDAILQIDYDVMSKATEALQVLVMEGKIQAFGIKVSLRPYSLYTPADTSHGVYQMLVGVLEENMAKIKDFADIVLYPINPTSSTPSTYPNLDADLEVYDPKEHGVEYDELSEANRKITRISYDPLICRRGRGFEDEQDKRHRIRQEAEALIELQRKEEEEEKAAYLEAEKAELEKEEREKVEGSEVVAAAAADDDAEKKGGDESEDETDEAPDELDHDEYGGYGVVTPVTAQTLVRTKKQIEAEILEAAKGAASGKAERYPFIDNSAFDNAAWDQKTEIHLISGAVSREFDEHISEALDCLCPKLYKTPRLQDKALRLVFSVGIDAVLMDAELSALNGKMTLTPKDLLSHEDTAEVFGQFVIPEAAMDMVHEQEKIRSETARLRLEREKAAALAAGTPPKKQIK